ncbi:hypothetical protein DSO57_1004024 [Entomophthora muscae]|uniref:Uncharacterized protein n=1 Tax=Entomophthora muscae TaxID=34485 RepID=A0ACC2T7Z4_9FUNG|nr:hypothetical protein DSO57_1004024 [Entomophthora muscae]
MKMYVIDFVDFVKPEEYGGHYNKNSGIIETIVHELCHGLGIFSRIEDYVQEYHTNSSGQSRDREASKFPPPSLSLTLLFTSTTYQGMTKPIIPIRQLKFLTSQPLNKGTHSTSKPSTIPKST